MKLAMRIGRHCRWREVKPRHFAELARACRYSPDELIRSLGDMAARLPDEASTLVAELRQAQIANKMLGRLEDGLATHCKNVADQLALRT
jgi:hypothetical protein